MRVPRHALGNADGTVMSTEKTHIYDKPNQDVPARNRIENWAKHAFELERAISDVLAACQEVGKDRCKVAR